MPPWRATILLIYEQRTGSFFHHVLANSNKGPITDALLWRALEKAATTIKKQPPKYQSIPSELCSAFMTVDAPINRRHQLLGRVYDDMQASSDPQNWQVRRYLAPPSPTYKVDDTSIHQLRKRMATTAKEVNGILISLRGEENNQGLKKSKVLKNKPEKIVKSRLERDPILAHLAPSWRTLYRLRYITK